MPKIVNATLNLENKYTVIFSFPSVIMKLFENKHTINHKKACISKRSKGNF